MGRLIRESNLQNSSYSFNTTLPQKPNAYHDLTELKTYKSKFFFKTFKRNKLSLVFCVNSDMNRGTQLKHFLLNQDIAVTDFSQITTSAEDEFRGFLEKKSSLMFLFFQQKSTIICPSDLYTNLLHHLISYFLSSRVC